MMKRTGITGAIAMLLSAPHPFAFAGDAAPAPPFTPTPTSASTPVDTTTLEEVIVQGTRGLDALRREMIALEDRYYERFNALNSNDLYDIHCAEEARTGTLVTHRFCRVRYEALALESEGQNHFAAREYSTRNPPQPWTPPVPAIVAIEQRREAFREEMLAVTSRHPELVELLRQRAELFERYEQLRRKSFGLAPKTR